MKIDKINCQILNLLQENCRMSLTKISKKIGLSVDSTKKRMDKLQENGLFFPKIQIRPRSFGYHNIIDVKIKIQNYEEKRIKEFIDYCIKNPRIAELFSISGEWNFTLVLIAKDYKDQAEITNKIRTEFGDIIGSGSESLTTTAYKFEKYDILKLEGYEDV